MTTPALQQPGDHGRSKDAEIPDPLTFVLVSVEGKDTADLDMEFDDDQQHAEQAIVLYVLALDADTTRKQPLTLVIPKSAGPELLAALLTEDQWEAVLDV